MKILLPIIIAAFVGIRLFLRFRRRDREKAPSASRRHGSLDYVLGRSLGALGLVAAREVHERTRGRVYRVATLLMLGVVAAAIIIPTIHSKNVVTSIRVGVVGGRQELSSAIDSASRGLDVTIQLVDFDSTARADRDLRSGRIDLAVVDDTRIILDRTISASDSSTQAQFAESLASALSRVDTIAAARLSATQVARLSHPITVPITGLSAGPLKNSTANGTSIIGLILLFVLLSQYSAWILIGVAEEKSSRVVEVLLGSLRPIQLLAGKVLGIGAAALGQAAVILVFALALAKGVGSDILQGTGALALASSLLWLVLGYAFYCWVYAAAGSLAELQDQLQSLSFPLSVPMLVGYIISITTASTRNHSTFFDVLAYLPGTSPFAMPVLVGLGRATWWGFLIAVAISLASTAAMARFAAGIYRRAILRTGQRVRLRDVLRAT